MARERVNKFSAESFINSIGQTLNPGDKVVAVTTGYNHKVRVFEGVFEGVYRGPSYSGDKNQVNGTRVGQVPVTRNERVYSETGAHEETDFKPKLVNGRFAGYETFKTGRRYDLVPKTRYRVSSLHRNRVFKIDTALTKVTI